jgi:hypothetical protein
MKIAVIGNCQAAVMANLLNIMVPGCGANTVNVGALKSGAADLLRIAAEATHVLVQTASWPRVRRRFEEAEGVPSKFHRYPTIFFNAFHPDFVFASGIRSAFGQPHSAICLHGWRQGYTVEETVGLYRREVFQALGYLDAWGPAAAGLIADGDEAGVDLRAPLEAWRRTGCFTYTPNHPNLRVMADLARFAADAMGLKSTIRYPDRMMVDPFATNIVWPVYPEVAAALGVQGEAVFKRSDGPRPPQLQGNTLDVRSFIERSFASYEAADRKTVACEALDDPRYALLDDLRLKPRRSSGNPYRGLPAHHFWRKAVAEPLPADLDPVVRVKFGIERSTRIATAGSCFAQHVARHLRSSGFHYYVAETPDGLETAEADRRNFGVFSARYGNLYTARQLLQLLDRSEGRFTPADDAWRRGASFIDPFRPEIEPDGFPSLDAMRASREAHLATVRTMWRNLDVFVFTLGLTEAWRSRRDGAVVPLAPGVSGEAPNPEDYEFCNFTAEEVTEDLRRFASRLRLVNPTARIILTVSPVPLIATFEDRHVLVSTTASKSILRVAAEAISRHDPMIDYFPSYEIITGAYNRGSYFADDLRGVTPDGVGHVMKVFLRHYPAASTRPEATSTGEPASIPQIRRMLAAARDVVCEEELLDVADAPSVKQ